MKNNETCFFYALYSDKTWVFDHSERAQGIYIIIPHNFYDNMSLIKPIHSINHKNILNLLVNTDLNVCLSSIRVFSILVT